MGFEKNAATQQTSGLRRERASRVRSAKRNVFRKVLFSTSFLNFYGTWGAPSKLDALHLPKAGPA